jgi:hypothetical protein
MSSSRRKLQLVASFALLLLIAVIGVGCNGFFVDPILQTITVGPTGVGILVGKTQQMTAIGTYDDGTQKTITGSTSTTWTTNDQTIASVSAAGLLTGVGAGNATVTATSGVATGSASITVSLTGVTSITVTPSSQSVSASGGIPFCLVATATPGSVDISTLNSTIWTFTDSNNGPVTGINKTSTATCTGQGFLIGTLLPASTAVVKATASAPGTNGTVTSPAAMVNVTP